MLYIYIYIHIFLWLCLSPTNLQVDSVDSPSLWLLLPVSLKAWLLTAALYPKQPGMSSLFRSCAFVFLSSAKSAFWQMSCVQLIIVLSQHRSWHIELDHEPRSNPLSVCCFFTLRSTTSPIYVYMTSAGVSFAAASLCFMTRSVCFSLVSANCSLCLTTSMRIFL